MGMSEPPPIVATVGGGFLLGGAPSRKLGAASGRQDSGRIVRYPQGWTKRPARVRSRSETAAEVNSPWYLTERKELLRKLRAIAKRYHGEGQAFEETLMDMRNNREVVGLRESLRGMGMTDEQIDTGAGDPAND